MCVETYSLKERKKTPNLSVRLLLRQDPFGSIFRKLKLALAATAVLYPQTRPSGLKGLLLGQSSPGAATWRKVTLPFLAGRGLALVTSGQCRAMKTQHPAKIWGDSEEVPVESAEDL